VNLASFLLGLAIGSSGILLYRMRLQNRLQQKMRRVARSRKRDGLSFSSQLIQTISDLEAEQQQLTQELIGLNQVINEGPLGYLRVDSDNQLLECNSIALKLLNIQDYPQNSTPRLLLELVRSYELDQLIEQARSSQLSGQKDWTFHPVSVDVVNVSAQIDSPLRGHAFPIANQQVVVLLESRQEAVLLSQQRDRWTSDVAHELKTPLTSIRLVAETLQPRVDPGLRQWVDRLLKEVIRLSVLVQEILDLSQLESEAPQNLKLGPIDLPQLIQSTWQSLEPLSRDRQINLDYHGPTGLIIQGDEARIFRVLINLFANSLKYSPNQQNIQVDLKLLENTHPHQIQLNIIDAGNGFSETDLTCVFERFYRGDPARARHDESTSEATEVTTSSSSGSGLGLAIVHQILDRHQGTVIAKNHPETGGAWIQIIMPQVPR
jgi:two-component system, OmpR family, phosphate regulon sensor histidine kinase PhoR